MIVRYADFRQWAVWLRVFTARDLAGSLGVSLEVAERGVLAMKYHGIVRDTDVTINGPDGDEPLVEWVPLPPGPTVHATQRPPELTTEGVYSEAPRRGMPVGMRNGRTRQSGVGKWRPGRSQGAGKIKSVEG